MQQQQQHKQPLGVTSPARLMHHALPPQASAAAGGGSDNGATSSTAKPLGASGAAAAGGSGGAAAAKARRKRLRKIRQHLAELSASYLQRHAPRLAAPPTDVLPAGLPAPGPFAKAAAALLKACPPPVAAGALAAAGDDDAPGAASGASGAPASISPSAEAALQQLLRVVLPSAPAGAAPRGGSSKEQLHQYQQQQPPPAYASVTPVLTAAAVRIDYERSVWSAATSSGYGAGGGGYATQNTFGNDGSGGAAADLSAVVAGDLSAVVRTRDAPPSLSTDTGVAPLPVTSPSCDALRTTGVLAATVRLLSREAATASPAATGAALRLLVLACASPDNRELLLCAGLGTHVADATAGLLADVAAMLTDRYGRDAASVAGKARAGSASRRPGSAAGTPRSSGSGAMSAAPPAAVAAAASSTPPSGSSRRWDDVATRENVTGALLAGLQVTWLLLRHCPPAEATPSPAAAGDDAATAAAAAARALALLELAAGFAHYAVTAGVPTGAYHLLAAYRLQDAHAQVTGAPLAGAAWAALHALARLPAALVPSALAAKPVYTPLQTYATAASGGPAPLVPACLEPLLAAADECQAFDVAATVISLLVAARQVVAAGGSAGEAAASAAAVAGAPTAPLPPGVYGALLHAVALLNALAALDLRRAQAALGEAPGAAAQTRHALEDVLAACGEAAGNLAVPPPSPASRSSGAGGALVVPALQALLVREAVVLVGHYALGHGANQDSLHWGLSPPTLLERLARLPVRYFTDAAGKAVLLPTLIAACAGSDANRAVVARELSGAVLAGFIADAVAHESSSHGGVGTGGEGALAAAQLRRRFPRDQWEAAAASFASRA